MRLRIVHQRMIAPFREQVKRQPNDALAYRKIAVLLSLTGDVPGAVAAFREAARIDPNDAGSRRQPGKLLHAQDDLKGAIAAFRDAIRIDPTLPGDHYNLAAALERIGDQESEVAELREAVRLEWLLRDPTSGARPRKGDGPFGDYWIDTLSDGVADMALSVGVHEGYKYSCWRIGLPATWPGPSRLTGTRSGSTPDRRRRLDSVSGWRWRNRATCRVRSRHCVRPLNSRALTHKHAARSAASDGATPEPSKHKPVPQVEPFGLLRAILMAARPKSRLLLCVAPVTRPATTEIWTGDRRRHQAVRASLETCDSDPAVLPSCMEFRRKLWPSNATTAVTLPHRRRSGSRVSPPTRSWLMT